MKVAPFKSLLNKHVGKEFMLVCPGKNILEHIAAIKQFAKYRKCIIIGSNKISELINLDYHMFTNNDKYETYGGEYVKEQSVLILGSHILHKLITKHKPLEYVLIKYTDRDPSEKIYYNEKLDILYGYYRTSGNLAIMLCHLMGASIIHIAGMSGFTFDFDGTVHYYKGEIKRDNKKRKEWLNRYDKPVEKSLNELKKIGIEFNIITPTVYSDHFKKIL